MHPMEKLRLLKKLFQVSSTHSTQSTKGAKKAKGAFRPTLIASLTAALFCAQAAQALETRYIYDAAGKPFLAVQFFDEGDYYYVNNADESASLASTWQLSEAQKQSLMNGLGFWSELLGPGSRNENPVPIYIATFDGYIAESHDFIISSADDDQITTWLIANSIMTGVEYGDRISILRIGPSDYAPPGMPSALPATSKWDLPSIISHEFAHALGIFSMAGGRLNMSVPNVSVWDTHLKDRYGTSLQPGLTVVSEDDPRAGTEGVFVVGYTTHSGVTFHGEHVAEVLGNDKGLSIEGIEPTANGEFTICDLSHIELEHGLMSHQNYRNYTSFMEAELAVMQDLGFDIDRRNFFGFSVYEDGQSIVNNNGYYARNAEGTDYLVGEENHATLGVGLHIYGKNNTVTQAADLLACGTAGTGIRIDGSGNRLAINPDVRIAANGFGGTGLLVAYGMDHVVTSRGTVEALGAQGIAARFDFGNNNLSNDSEYRGSWIWTTWFDGVYNLPILDENGAPFYDYSGLPLNLNGALVKQFDVSGTLAGSAAAIYIASNAWVENINILTGASITGDIISLWDPEDSRIQYPGDKSDLHTQLTFGLAPEADGSASDIADASFDMTLAGAVDGDKSIDMTLAAGHLAVTGPVHVLSLQNKGHLALLGADDQGFGAAVAGHFENTAAAVLEAGFHADGSVAGIKAQSATLAGTLLLRPLADFYAEGETVALKAPVVTEGSLEGGFSSVALGDVLSPTLQFTLTSETNQAQSETRLPADALSGNFNAAFTVNRAENAYSRWAADGAGTAVGSALETIAANAQGDMQSLVAALDWSDASGSEIRTALTQLGPQAYDLAAEASLGLNAQLNAMMTGRLLMLKDAAATPLLGKADETTTKGDGQVWAAPVGIHVERDGSASRASAKSTGGGVVAGVEHRIAAGGTVGLHAALLSHRTTMRDGIDAEGESFSAFAGVHGAYAPERWGGAYVLGQARAGFEDASMTRSTAVNGYLRRSSSDWTGFAASALLGVGKDFTLTGDKSRLALGPVVWTEYSLLRRPGLTEKDGAATNLAVHSQTYESLSWSLGGHVRASAERANGDVFGLGLLAAWHHDVKGSFSTRATFAGYETQSFASSTERAGDDALLLEGSLTLAQKNGFRLQLNGGGQFFGADGSAATFGLTLGWAL